jgi:hypothetical protein
METRVPTERGWLPALILADRWIYDTELIETGDSQQEYFRTTAGKDIQEANFEGDFSLVPEGHIFQVIAHHVRIVHINTAPYGELADTVAVFNEGYFDWRIQGSTTDENALYHVAGGLQFIPRWQPAHAGTEEATQVGTGDRANCRRYAVEKYVPGGRSIKYFLYWPGGITLTESKKVQPGFYGNELMLKV